MISDFKYESKDLENMVSATNYHLWILSKFEKFLGKRVAEVGAGSGNFSLKILKKPVQELITIEPSKNVFDKLVLRTKEDKRVINHNTFLSNVSNMYKNYFDSIVYVDVLEHIEKDKEELSIAHSCLNQGGYVCIFVPALMWLYSNHDKSIGHFKRYYKQELKKLFQETGFEVVKLEYFDLIGIIPWFLLFKLLKIKPSPGRINLNDKFIVPVSKFLESFISPPIGKNLVAVGRKSGTLPI